MNYWQIAGTIAMIVLGCVCILKALKRPARW